LIGGRQGREHDSDQACRAGENRQETLSHDFSIPLSAGLFEPLSAIL
jgi:hypothetical protein